MSAFGWKPKIKMDFWLDGCICGKCQWTSPPPLPWRHVRRHIRVHTHVGTYAAFHTQSELTLASVTLNSLRMYWGMLYSAIGSTTKYWYLADRSAGQYWWHFSYKRKREGRNFQHLNLNNLSPLGEKWLLRFVIGMFLGRLTVRH